MCFDDLPVSVLKQIGFASVKNAGTSAADACRVFSGFDPASSGFDSGQLYCRVLNEPGENPHCVAAAADTGDHLIRKLSGLFKTLSARFFSDYGLEVADDCRIRVRARDRSDDIERVVAPCGPFPDRLIHGILERGGTVRD